ncbi:MAG: hypothetical protein ONB23_03670 [candidate division KSB1 bacterium]|nr:hypothetical protein [candidate division KSB1 bacterium]
MDELLHWMKDEAGRLERKFEKLFEDVSQRQQEILQALERLERDRMSLVRAVERLEKAQEEMSHQLLTMMEALKR